MPIRTRMWDWTGGRLLAAAGRAGTLTTVGRTSGQPRLVRCAFIRRPSGSLIVGSAKGRRWPDNLAAAGWCTFEAKGMPRREYDAVLLTGSERDEAVAALSGGQDGRAAAMYSGHIFELRPRATA